MTIEILQWERQDYYRWHGRRLEAEDIYDKWTIAHLWDTYDLCYAAGRIQNRCSTLEEAQSVAQSLQNIMRGSYVQRSLNDMAKQVYEWAVTKGWEPDDDRRFGDEIALIHSETSEALEAYRDFHDFAEHIVDGKPEGVPSEFADILIRLLNYSYTKDIDLDKEFDTKMAYNAGRPWRHGGKPL